MVTFEVHYENGVVDCFEVEDDRVNDTIEALIDTEVVVWYFYKHN